MIIFKFKKEGMTQFDLSEMLLINR